MAEPSQLQSRRAIEALRAGVPNRDAVGLLGSAQPQIEERFQQHLAAIQASISQGTQAPGLLIAGDFGAGKSHLLEYCEHLALEQRFVCSKIVISKETPLFDPAKLYRVALHALVVPDRRSHGLTEVAASLDCDSPGYPDLLAWASGPGAGLNSRFPATLFLYGRITSEEERNRLVGFWSGDPLSVADLRRWLRAEGESAAYPLESLAARDLALQRFRFAPRLIAAAGYAGWVLLIDEVELIGRYSFKQRARSYAELARWAGKLDNESYLGLGTVFAITADFAAAVLEDRNDAEAVPGKLRASLLESDQTLASQAERGIRLLQRDSVRLRPPTRETIDETRAVVRELHAQAYRWQPPALTADPRLSTTSMRQYVRRWINEWDPRRLEPTVTPDTLIADFTVDYSENPDLEQTSEEDGEVKS